MKPTTRLEGADRDEQQRRARRSPKSPIDERFRAPATSTYAAGGSAFRNRVLFLEATEHQYSVAILLDVRKQAVPFGKTVVHEGRIGRHGMAGRNGRGNL